MKKLLTVVLFSLIPAVALSQQTIDPAMMQQLQEMATCMAKIDQNELKSMEKDAKIFEKKVNGLCKSGKREEAQQKALEFSKQMMKSPALIIMRKCTENMPAALKGMVPDMSAERIAKDFKEKHVCDEIQPSP